VAREKDKGEGFIRPVNWRKPLEPLPPSEPADLHIAYRPLESPGT
jgi:hypothetical protein